MPSSEFVARSDIERYPTLVEHFLEFLRRDCLQLRQLRQRGRSRAIDRRVLQKIVRPRRKVRCHLPHKLVAVFNLQRVVREPLGADGGEPLRPHVASAQRPRPVRRIHHHAVG